MSYNLEQSNGGFESLSAAGLAEGTNANTFKTSNTLVYTNDGVFKSKAATNNVAFSSAHTQVPASSTCLFGVWIDSAGNFIVNSDDSTANVIYDDSSGNAGPILHSDHSF